MEFLILVAGILLTTTSLFYLSLVNNEIATITQAAHDGTESAIAAIETKYGCSLNLDYLQLRDNLIEISIVIVSAPSENINWLEFKENIVKKTVEEYVLNHIQHALGARPSTTNTVKTAFCTYVVSIRLKEGTL
ncbi:MAG: hypothetical protein ACPL6F_00585 [Anaerolineales bacterium]|uniref:hypothetical protein n=1 Tax=Candidatus Hadarchaeum sp. TaxID=2883567 RepID=UPI003C7EE224